MADGTRGDDNRSATSAEEAALSARLRHLGDRLDRTVPARQSPSESGAQGRSDPSGLARALRLSAELIGGVIVGTGIGWMLDRLLGTSPWGFIVFLLLGFAGGVFTVMRSAGVIPPRQI
ncbi:MAG TPA: AtpZ/AtpI family protein [Xanthobacteraceae bacterium]